MARLHWFQECGATTMWEAWECDTARSQDHGFMGTIDDWFFTDLAGIQPTSEGFRTIQIKPYLVGGLTTAAAHQSTPLGQVSSGWNRSGTRLDITVRIPVGATAQVLVPAKDRGAVRAPADATFIGMRDGYATFSVNSGSYSFESAI